MLKKTQGNVHSGLVLLSRVQPKETRAFSVQCVLCKQETNVEPPVWCDLLRTLTD